MKHIINKKNTPFPFAALLYFILLSLLLTGTVKAEAIDSHDRVMLLHPFFESHNWKLSSDTVVFNINSTFKTHTPTNVSVAGNDTTAWFTYNHSSKVYLIKVDITYPASQFQNVILSSDEPTELSEVSSGQISNIFVPDKTSPTSLILATSDSSSINLYSINGTSKTVGFDTSASFTISDKIFSLFGTNNDSNLSLSGPSLWVGGENGSIKRLMVDNLSNVSAHDYNISASETISAINQNICGTLSGKIFEQATDTFTLIANFSGNTIINIHKDAALTSNGSAIVKVGNSWNLHSSIATNPNMIHKTYKRGGTGVELLSSDWSYSTSTLSDSLTNITFNNSDFTNQWGSGFLILQNPTISEVTLSDLDKNYSLPILVLNDLDTLLKSDSILISNTIPDRDFTMDTTDLADSVFSIQFEGSTIQVKITTRKRTFNPISLKNSWTISEEDYTFLWNSGDELTINLNGKFLVLSNAIDQTVAQSSSINQTVNAKNIYFKENRLILDKNINTPFTIKLFSLNGRTIFQKLIEPSTSEIQLSGIANNQMVIAVLFFDNGNKIKVPLRLLK